MDDLALVWLRRDLRLYDHKPLHYASKHKSFLPIFIFDPKILSRFTNIYDRRLSFIASALLNMLKSIEILIVYGDPCEIIPKLSEITNASKIYAGRDFEPENMKRDQNIAKMTARLSLLDDHIIKNPEDIKRNNGKPFRIYTPFSKAWRESVKDENIANYQVDLGKYIKNIDNIKVKLKEAGVKVLDTTSVSTMLEGVGYKEFHETLWNTECGRDKLHNWANHGLSNYKENRDYMDQNGTSMLSPYIRFGLISIRECYNIAINYGSVSAEAWLNELIWREFYIYILYHFPESQHLELQEKYRNMVWNNNPKYIKAWKEGKTGYPIVDAAMRQLKEIGWMHNRARMITASFLTKHLLTDWRIGEEHFAQYLMDYELASNVGGWQWASSTGTDAQPYFRIFNPFLQSKKFDPEGNYIRTYVPELRSYKGNIHEPHLDGLMNITYYPLIVEHKKARLDSISAFKDRRLL